jgi:hypothetical protein
MKTLQLLSYEYPDLVRVMIGPCIYTYRSSEYVCRKFDGMMKNGAKFNALNWFKMKAELVNKEKG